MDNRGKFYQNNFDIVRLFAAFQVFFMHSIGYLHINNIQYFIIDFFELFPGVPIFFVISGFLISASLEKSKSLKQYFLNRFLRIYPALWISIIVAIIAMLLFYDVNVGFVNITKWIMAQATILQFYHNDVFDSYGMGNLNGALWTLSIELQFYILLALVYTFFNNKINKVFKILFIVSFVITICYKYLGLNNLYYMKLIGVSLLPYLHIFLIGVFLQRNFNFVQKYLSGKFIFWGWIYILFYLLFSDTKYYSLFYIVPMSLFIISFSYSITNLSYMLLKNNDISYGVYIYHLIIINIFITIDFVGEIYHFVIALALVFFIAYLSWNFIEKPALNLKKINGVVS